MLRLPADVLQKPEVFAELDSKPLSLDEVLLFDGDPEVAYSAEVVEDELVERVSTLPVDRPVVLPGTESPFVQDAEGKPRDALGSRSWRVPSPSHRSYVFGAGPRSVFSVAGATIWSCRRRT